MCICTVIAKPIVYFHVLLNVMRHKAVVLNYTGGLNKTKQSKAKQAQRIEYKILLLTYKAFHGIIPIYFQELIDVSHKGRSLMSNIQVPITALATHGSRSFAADINFHYILKGITEIPTHT